jgi:hypothetical protein
VAQRNDVERKAAVYAAFYHRTRAAFVMWTKEEIAMRSGVSIQTASSILRSLAHSREAKTVSLSGNSDYLGWHLTDAGERAAKVYLGAEAGVTA